MEDPYAPIEEFWDGSSYLYHNLFSSPRLHYGIWDEATASLNEAAERAEDYYIQLLKIADGDKVLDAGCGFGATTIKIAKRFGVEVVGISLSQEQIDIAKRKHAALDLDNLQFLRENYISTSFDNDQFTKILAIESVAYAVDKRDFLSEATRVLRPGGQIVIVDGWLVRPPTTRNERKSLQDILHGFKIPDIPTMGSFEFNMREFGFDKIAYFDITQDVKKSIHLTARKASSMLPLVWMLTRTKRISSLALDNLRAIRGINRIHRAGLLSYGAFVADLPK